MLKKFSVENFKGFKDMITLDLGSPSNYSFHSGAIQDGCITKGIVLGRNGSGKTNLGLAVFDLVHHLTDQEKQSTIYSPYLNMDGRKSFAGFEYTFVFDKHELVYRYSKTDLKMLKEESLSIDQKEVIYYDHLSRNGFTTLKGTEPLNVSITNESPISRILFVHSHCILADDVQSRVFEKFIDFVERMFFFYSLDNRGQEGFPSGSESIADEILSAGKLKDFQLFLKGAGICYNLYEREVDGKRAIYCHFENMDIDFFQIASSGTKSLALFYAQYIRMEKASFVYMDDFDAFYHFTVSKEIQKRVMEIPGTQIFTTTHNTDLITNDLLRPDCYFLLQENSIRPLSALTKKELRFAHNLQKMYKAGTFNQPI